MRKLSFVCVVLALFVVACGESNPVSPTTAANVVSNLRSEVPVPTGDDDPCRPSMEGLGHSSNAGLGKAWITGTVRGQGSWSIRVDWAYMRHQRGDVWVTKALFENVVTTGCGETATIPVDSEGNPVYAVDGWTELMLPSNGAAYRLTLIHSGGGRKACIVDETSGGHCFLRNVNGFGDENITWGS